MAGRLRGRVAIVTGAGRGIGRAITMLMAQEGAQVVVNDAGVNPQGSGHGSGPADQVVAEILDAGGIAVANYDSVATMAGGEHIIQTALDSFDRLDILVNNAGIIRDCMIFNMTEEEWDAVIAVHLKGHFACTKPASLTMRRQGYGRLINFSSESGTVGNPGQCNYATAKAAIAGFTRVLARELGGYGVTCNAILPRAWTRLAAATLAGGVNVPEASRVQRLDPDAIAPMAAYLASEEAACVNGQLFVVYAGTVGVCCEPMPWRTIFKTDGCWNLDELSSMVPQMMKGSKNPAPPAADLEIPERSKRGG